MNKIKTDKRENIHPSTFWAGRKYGDPSPDNHATRDDHTVRDGRKYGHPWPFDIELFAAFGCDIS